MNALRAPRALSVLTPTFDDIGSLKRVRRAGSAGSVATLLFLRAWGSLVEGRDPAHIAAETTALALVATRLGGIDGDVLAQAGLTRAECLRVLLRAFDHAAAAIDVAQRVLLRDALASAPAHAPERAVPPFARALAEQPRAGATALGAPRLILEPPESHAEHCAAVAMYGVLAAPRYGADPATVFLLALAHHLHNARLPDAGFAGEELLGEYLEPIVASFTSEALRAIPATLAQRIVALRPLLREAESPEARAFHAADVIDRVLQVRHYARVAAFEVSHALDDLDLVHAGPLQSFHASVLAEAHLP